MSYSQSHYSAFQTFRQLVFRKGNENTKYFAYLRYDFQKDKPKTISEIHSKGVKSSRLSNLMRLKVRQCTFAANIISLTVGFNRGARSFL